MIRKAYIVGTLALGLALAGLEGTSGINRIASSAHSVERYFHTLKSGNSLSPLERLVFSLVFANADMESRKITPPS